MKTSSAAALVTGLCLGTLALVLYERSASSVLPPLLPPERFFGKVTLPLPATRLLVTGAAGFIGFHAVANLAEHVDHVVGVDNMVAIDDEHADLQRVRAELLRSAYSVQVENRTVCDEHWLTELIRDQKINAVLHLAAMPGVRRSTSHPRQTVIDNVLCTQALFQAVAAQEHPVRIVYASSSSVYGLNERAPFREDDPTDRVASIYAATKRATESLAAAYHNLYGIPMLGLRFFTVYGPLGRTDMAIHMWLKAIHEGRQLQLFTNADGSLPRRSFTFVDDIVLGIRNALQASFACDVVNLGNTNSVTIRHVLEAIERFLGRKGNVVEVEKPGGDVPLTEADNQKAQRLLQYRATTSIDEGLEVTARWFAEWATEGERQWPATAANLRYVGTKLVDHAIHDDDNGRRR